MIYTWRWTKKSITLTTQDLWVVFPYEEASRGPLLIYAPGTKSEGKKWRSNALVGNIDMAPTILDAAGLEIPKHMDGKSLLK